MDFIGAMIAILLVGGFVALIVWRIMVSDEEKAEAEKQRRQHRQQQRQAMIALAQARVKEIEQAAQQAIQDEYHQLQVNLAALDAEIQMIQISKQAIAQQGMELEEVELLLQKRQLERRLVALEMQGVTQKSLYDDTYRRIEQIETKLEVIERGDVARLIIKQQGKIRDCLQQIAQEQSIALEDLRKDLEKRFTSVEVENILLRADVALKEVLAMTAAALKSP